MRLISHSITNSIFIQFKLKSTNKNPAAVSVYPSSSRSFSCHSLRIKMAPTPVLLSSSQISKSNIHLESHESAFREGSATIVLPSKEAAFLNPVQEFNRDISALAITTWSQRDDLQRREKWEARQLKKSNRDGGKGKARKGNKRAKVDVDQEAEGIVEKEKDQQDGDKDKEIIASSSTSNSQAPAAVWRPHKFTLFEALAATGLRSIRYANEIPLVKWILANDLSPTAVAAMRRNVALNFPATEEPIPEWNPDGEGEGEAGEEISTSISTKDLDEDEMMEMENKSLSTSKINHENQTESTNGSAKALERAVAKEDKKGKSKEVLQDPSSAATTSSSSTSSTTTTPVSIHPDCKIKISQADATSILYSHRSPSDQFDVIDLDPYGSAVPFLDGALQSVSENGLLCVTCTDLAVLAGHNYPEKAYSAYGGVSGKSEYVHEIALRLLLHSIEMTAARYGRTIQPLLSLSIDFYVRVFLLVKSSPKEVKNVATRNGIVYLCSGCGDFREQRFGKATPQGEGKDGKDHSGNLKYSSAVAAEIPASCPECRSRYHVSGPLYLGPMHDKSFCDNMVEILEQNPKRYRTAGRIRGMVGLAADELDSLFYFTPTKIAGTFHCTCPSVSSVISAILHSGYQASRSHCSAGSIKTNAPRAFIYDLFRTFIKLPGNQVKMNKMSETSPSFHLNNKEPNPIHGEIKIGPEVQEHPDTKKVLNGTITRSSRDGGLVGTRYQMNPLPNWGPGTAAKGHTGKRKRDVDGEKEKE